MPVKDGFEATGDIRALGYSDAIIAVSGNALVSDIQKFKTVGGTGKCTITPRHIPCNIHTPSVLYSLCLCLSVFVCGCVLCVGVSVYQPL